MTERLTREERERLQRSRAVAEETQLRLVERGLFVPLRALWVRPFNDCVNAQSWARNLRPTKAMPPWLAELVGAGVAQHLGGWCRECGASDRRSVGFRVRWADKSDTLCVSCASSS